jgi:hypothetical protein
MPTMTLPQTTFGRIILAVLVLWFLVGVFALVLLSAGGSVPGDGQGERMQMSR